ncbi:MAG TPA: glycoside hydrolase family 3 N-terminal domain-containing protein, partial [Trueperaceae bacterium]
ELSALGVNMNLAPVLDLASRPENPVVGLRSFGDEPDLVSRLGLAMVLGMQEAGVLACAKHFPGHGNTAIDSHHAAASVDRTLEELQSLELIPFEAAFAAGLGAVMAAHVHYPQLQDLPATFSPVVLRDVLRGHLGFTGLSVTDALDMHALAQVPGPDRARTALEAGADLAILGHLPRQEEIVADLADLWLPESLERVTTARAALPPFVPRSVSPAVGWSAHAASAKEMATSAITVVRGAGSLPLDLNPDDRVCVVTVAAGNLTPAETIGNGNLDLAAHVRRRHPNVTSVRFEFGSHGVLRDAAIREVLEAARGAHSVLLATVDAVADVGQQELFAALLRRRHDPVVMALRSPLDVSTLEGSRIALCTYGRRDDQVAAAVAVLFGEVRPTGQLPVRIETHADVADVRRG